MHQCTIYEYEVFLPAATGLPQAYKLLFISSSSSIIAKVQKVQKFNIFDLTHTMQSC